jgi:VCBS repeat protein
MAHRLARRVPILAGLLWAVLLVPCRLRAQCIGCSKPSFDGPRSYELPGGPLGTPPIALGDFNGDGYLDVVIYDGTDSLLVFPGSPSGSFGQPSSRITGFTPGAIVSGDFNGDGNLDVIAASFGSNLNLFLGDGTGSLGSPIVISTPTSIQSLAAGDFNGDGLLDLAYLDGLDNVVLLFGASGGTIGNPQTLPVGPNPGSLTVADLNGDGRADVVVCNLYGDTVSIVLGRSSGPYPPALDYPIGFSPTAVAVGDFSGDGKPDLAVLSDNYSTGTVELLYGFGDGRFVVGPSFSVSAGTSIVAADFTGDGKTDLLIGGGSLALYKGSGIGGFTLDATSAGTVQNPILLVGDLNRDGVPDVVAGNGGLQNFAVFLSQAGRLNLSKSVAVNSSFTAPSTAVDFDGSGHPGLIVATCCSQLSIYTSDGTGNLSPGGTVPFSGNVSFLASADLNGDGKGDLVVADSYGSFVYVMLGTGSGSFSSPMSYAVQNGPLFTAITDLNRDGIPDLVVANFNSNSVSVLLGAGGGVFHPATSFSVGAEPISLAVGNFDGDPFPDVVSANSGGSSVSVLLGDGTGGFRSIQVIPVGAAPNSVVSGDFDGDGKTDLALLLGQYSPPISLAVRKGDGAGNFGPPSTVSLSGAPSHLMAADLNGDGRPDLVLGGSLPGGLAVRMNDGSGGFPTSVGYSVGSFTSVGVADFDGDGTLDLFSSTASGVSVLLNTRCRARHLGLMQDLPACDAVGAAFATQPKVGIFDDGDNVVVCATGAVGASLAPGTGSPGAALGGTTTMALSSGSATFTNLFVNTAGSGYEILFQHPVAGTTLSRAFRVGGPSPVTISGPSSFCSTDTVLFHADPGFDSYVWSLDGSTVGTGPDLTLNAVQVGPHTLEVQGNAGGCLASGSIPISVALSPAAPAASNNSPILIGQTLQLFATTVPGASYSWTGPNGFTSTLQNPTIANATALATGLYTVRAVLGGCSSAAATTSVTVANPVAFYTVTPCRVVDTRAPTGPTGGPPLAAGAARTFVLAGSCGVPPTATAVSVNVTVTQSTAIGDLRLFPGGNPPPLVSTINYKAGQTRANNAVASLGPSGDITLRCDQPGGTVDLILDVNGYFQ